MDKAPELAEWGFIPAAEDDVEVHRRAFPWTLFSVALLAGAVTGAAVGAAWTIVPPLAETPVLEGSRSHEPSEIWTEAANQHALARTRALLDVPAKPPAKVIDDAAPAAGIKLRSLAPAVEHPDSAASDNPY